MNAIGADLDAVLRELELAVARRHKKPTVPAPGCQLCRDVGWVEVVIRPGYPGVRQCECYGWRRGLERLACAGIPGQLADADLRERSGIPARPYDWTAPPVGAAVREALIEWCAAVRRGYDRPHLLLVGPTGAGKSHLAAALCRWAALDCPAQGWSPLWRRWSDVLDAHGRDADRDEQARLHACSWLVLDELTARGREWGAELLAELLDDRTSARRPTVCTANLVEGQLGDRVASRLAGAGRIIEVVGPDYRRRAEGNR